jgi:plastocyanin
MILTLAVSAACGGNSATTPTAAATAARTATRPSAAAAVTSPATTATQPAATAATTDATPGTTLTLSEKNNLFDRGELKATPGEVTFVVRNEDKGIPHNFHLYKGNDTTGQDMGNTQIEVGPSTQTFKVNLTAGPYYYNCDVHPATAFGKLEVR